MCKIFFCIILICFSLNSKAANTDTLRIDSTRQQNSVYKVNDHFTGLVITDAKKTSKLYVHGAVHWAGHQYPGYYEIIPKEVYQPDFVSIGELKQQHFAETPDVIFIMDNHVVENTTMVDRQYILKINTERIPRKSGDLVLAVLVANTQENQMLELAKGWEGPICCASAPSK